MSCPGTRYRGGNDEQNLKKERERERERKKENRWEKDRLKSWHSSGHSHETDKSEKPKDSNFSSPCLHLQEANESAFCFPNVWLLC